MLVNPLRTSSGTYGGPIGPFVPLPERNLKQHTELRSFSIGARVCTRGLAVSVCSKWSTCAPGLAQYVYIGLGRINDIVHREPNRVGEKLDFP